MNLPMVVLKHQLSHVERRPPATSVMQKRKREQDGDGQRWKNIGSPSGIRWVEKGNPTTPSNQARSGRGWGLPDPVAVDNFPAIEIGHDAFGIGVNAE